MGEDVFDPEPIVGAVAAREYHDSPEWAKPKLREWVEKLPSLSDKDLLGETCSAIHGSALTNSWRGNWEHEHCKASACSHESRRRMVRDGHGEWCGPSIYTRAYRDVTLGQGYDWPDDSTCRCKLSPAVVVPGEGGEGKTG